MDAIRAASANYCVVLAPGELLCTATDTNDALIGHPPEFEQQLHQLHGSESAAAPGPSALRPTPRMKRSDQME